MLHIQKIHNRFFRYVGLITIVVFGIISTLGSGGGSDGGGVEQPTTFMYTLSGPNAGDPISAATSWDMNSITVTVTPTLEGTYNSSSDVYTLSATCQGGNCFITASTVGSAGFAFGNIVITITDRWLWVDENYPTQGQVEITSNAIPGTTVTGIINPSATVDISLTDDTDTFELSWDQFENRWRDPEHPTDNPFWLRMASFAFSLKGLLFDQVGLLGETYLVIEDNRSDLESFGVFNVNCSISLPPDPPGNDWDNTIAAVWTEHGIDGLFDSDETVSFLMVNCWVDDPYNPIGGTLLNGLMVLNDLTPYSVSCPEFTMLTVEETENSDTIPDSGYLLNGGFCFSITEI